MSQQLRAKAVTRVRAMPAFGADEPVDLEYAETKFTGKGGFGVVVSAKLVDSGDMIAIKKVLQEKMHKNRELQTMQTLEHQNIVRLKYFFYSDGDKKGEVYLNLMMEYMPESLHDVANRFKKNRQTIPAIYIKVGGDAWARPRASVAGVDVPVYIHSLGICHRDVKPPNMLVDQDSALLNLCDFGSSKRLVPGELNKCLICTRYYRALELLLCAKDYTTKIGRAVLLPPDEGGGRRRVVGRLLARRTAPRPPYPGDPYQFYKICEVRGTPTRAQWEPINPNYIAPLHQARGRSWAEIFHEVRVPREAVDLVSRLLEYTPNSRPSPLQACAHDFFDQLRTAACRLPNGRRLPPLFNFTEQELRIEPSLNATLVPAHTDEAAASDDDDDSASQPSTTTVDDDDGATADDGASVTHYTGVSTGAPTQRTTSADPPSPATR